MRRREIKVKIPDAERDFYTALGKRLQIMREREGVTLYKMAERLEALPSTVLRWETGENRISLFNFVNYRRVIREISE